MADGAVDIMSVIVPNKASVPQTGYDHLGYFDWWPNPIRFNAQLTGGFAGWGIIWEDVPHMWVCLVFAIVWLFVRFVAKKAVFPPLARALGIKGRSTQQKFCYQMWLLAFYASSSLFGWYYALPGERYFQLPMDKEGAMSLWDNHPVPIQERHYWYYMYQLGFYIAELYAICAEPKRSDFVEYAIHHVVTIYLIAVSYLAHEHRVGTIIILIHDIPDVFLCVTKFFLYQGYDNVAPVFFAMFAGSFGYLRLYCFPIITYSIFCLAPQFHPATYLFWSLAFLLGFVLQGLQVFWGLMIVKLVAKLVINKGDHEGDPRSGSDDDDDGDAASKGKKKVEATKGGDEAKPKPKPKGKRVAKKEE